MTLKLAVLASGTGTNLQAMIDAIGDGRLDAEIKVVIADRPRAKALVRAEKAGIPSRVFRKRDHDGRDDLDAAVVGCLQAFDVEWVALAGYMRIIGPVFLRAYEGRVLNIHPALLPSFPGLHAVAQALSYGVKVSGCTVHFVDEGVDTGPIIAQASVAVRAGDSLADLTSRIQREEHRLYPAALQWLAQGDVTRAEGRRVITPLGYQDFESPEKSG